MSTDQALRPFLVEKRSADGVGHSETYPQNEEKVEYQRYVEPRSDR